MDGKSLKTIIELSTTPEKIDEALSKYTTFETTKEKIAFLLGMFYELDMKIIDQEKDDPDELTYQCYLNGIVHHYFG